MRQDRPSATRSLRATLVPEQTASGLIDYSLTKGSFAGFGAGFGVRYSGVTAADLENTFLVPGWTLYDASLHFNWRSTRFAVNATNLTDRRYVAVCSSLSYCNYGYARNIIGSARLIW